MSPSCTLFNTEFNCEVLYCVHDKNNPKDLTIGSWLWENTSLFPVVGTPTSLSWIFLPTFKSVPVPAVSSKISSILLNLDKYFKSSLSKPIWFNWVLMFLGTTFFPA